MEKLISKILYKIFRKLGMVLAICDMCSTIFCKLGFFAWKDGYHTCMKCYNKELDEELFEAMKSKSSKYEPL